MEHSDAGGTAVRATSARDVWVALVRDAQGGPLLSVGLKPRPVRSGALAAPGLTCPL